MTAAKRSFPRTPLGVRFLWYILFFVLPSFSGCESEPQSTKLELKGQTMGTTYSVTLIHEHPELSPEDVQAGIDEVLEEVNRQMSNWIEDSEISRFNASTSTDWFEVSPATAYVISESIRISGETEGAFDITVAPLIEAWGFGPGGREAEPPSESELEKLAQIIGSDKLESQAEPSALKKSVPELTVNLSAVAKGYGVDAVCDYLKSFNINQFLVEIGGEVRVSGFKSDGSKWRIGVERPATSGRSLQTSVALADRAMATSGDYRNFVEVEGKKYSHTIDPESMKPIKHTLASVSVVRENCLEADALATGLMVMGPIKGYNWAEEQKVAALFLIHQDDGIIEKPTSGWTQILGEVP